MKENPPTNPEKATSLARKAKAKAKAQAVPTPKDQSQPVETILSQERLKAVAGWSRTKVSMILPAKRQRKQ